MGEAVGVTNILVLMLAVDVVIGPLLTFVIFDRRKKSLRIDLLLIIALQLLAFFYGMYAVAQGRPAWIVFNVDRFDIVRAYEIDNREVDFVHEDFKFAPWFGPKWVAAILPDDAKERAKLLQESLSGGADLAQRPKYYVSLDVVKPKIMERVKKPYDLLLFNNKNIITNFSDISVFGWLPLMANHTPMVVIVDKLTGELKIVPLRPW